jgi:hypothetical protein
MTRAFVTLTFVLLTALAAPAMAQGRHGLSSLPQYRSQAYHSHRHRSQFQYRNPYQWQAEKNYLRHRSLDARFYGGYYESYFFGYGAGQRYVPVR